MRSNKTILGRFFNTGITLAILMMFLGVPLAEGKSGDVITWKMSSFEPGVSLMGLIEKWWADELEKRTNGRLKVTIYPSEQLCSAKEMLDAVSSNLAQVVCVVPAYYPGRIPLSTLHYLPYAAPYRCDLAGLLMNKMADHPMMKKEIDKQNAVVAFYHSSKTYDVMSRKPIKTVDDFKGLKIRAAGDQAALFRMLGATPVTTTAPEAYSAVERGLVDAAPGCGEYWFVNWRIFEPLKSGYYVRNINCGMAGFWVLMNKDAYNALPADIKTIIQRLKWEMPSVLHEYTASKHLVDFFLERFKKAGMRISDLPAQESNKLEALGEKLAEQWKARNEKQGAQEYYDAYIKEKKNVMKRFPEGIYMDERPLKPSLAEFLPKLF